jgi:two-component system sensor histidine kinase VicK
MNKVGFFKSIQFKVVLIYTLLILLAMQLIGVYFADRVKTITLDSFENSLESQSQLIAWNVGEAIRQAQESNVEDPNHVADQIQNQLLEIDANIREIEVIDDNMVIVAADEKHRDAVGKRTTNQLAVQNLSSTSTNKFRRADRSSGERVDIVTTPIMVDNHRYGMLYVEKSFENVYEQLQQINQVLATATIFALLVTAILGFFLARTITRPLVQMQRQVMAVSQGGFSRKLYPKSTNDRAG